MIIKRTGSDYFVLIAILVDEILGINYAILPRKHLFICLLNVRLSQIAGHYSNSSLARTCVRLSVIAVVSGSRVEY